MLLLGKTEAIHASSVFKEARSSIYRTFSHPLLLLARDILSTRVKERGFARQGAPGHFHASPREPCGGLEIGMALRGLSDPYVPPRRSELKPKMGTGACAFQTNAYHPTLTPSLKLSILSSLNSGIHRAY